MLDQVSGKEHTRLHALFLDIFDYLVPIHALLAGQKETKPARSGVLARLRQDQLVGGVCQRCFQPVEVMTSALHKARELVKLRASDGCLQIGCL